MGVKWSLSQLVCRVAPERRRRCQVSHSARVAGFVPGLAAPHDDDSLAHGCPEGPANRRRLRARAVVGAPTFKVEP